MLTHWRDGRVVDCIGLENRRTERYRGFESLSLRKRRKPERLPSLLLERHSHPRGSSFVFAKASPCGMPSANPSLSAKEGSPKGFLLCFMKGTLTPGGLSAVRKRHPTGCRARIPLSQHKFARKEQPHEGCSFFAFRRDRHRSTSTSTGQWSLPRMSVWMRASVTCGNRRLETSQ